MSCWLIFANSYDFGQQQRLGSSSPGLPKLFSSRKFLYHQFGFQIRVQTYNWIVMLRVDFPEISFYFVSGNVNCSVSFCIRPASVFSKKELLTCRKLTCPFFSCYTVQQNPRQANQFHLESPLAQLRWLAWDHCLMAYFEKNLLDLL